MVKYKNETTEMHDKAEDGAQTLFEELIDEGASHWADRNGHRRSVRVSDIELIYADEIEAGMPILAAIAEYIDSVINHINGSE